MEFVRAQLNRLFVISVLLIALPAIAIGEKIRRGRGRRIARGCILAASRLCGVTYEVKGSVPPGDGSYIFVPNHSSLLDIPAVLVACTDVRFIAAAELFRIPLLAAAMRALRTVPIERRDPAVARGQLAALVEEEHGRTQTSNLVIFPEGGIAPRGTRLPFKSGAFALAIQTGVPIVPVAIHHSDDVLAPRRRLAVRPGVVTVELLDMVPTTDLSMEDRGALRDQVHHAVVGALAAGTA
jgi:1-acyl-sn-glycerol-3-phosphate acyltransferase